MNWCRFNMINVESIVIPCWFYFVCTSGHFVRQNCFGKVCWDTSARQNASSKISKAYCIILIHQFHCIVTHQIFKKNYVFLIQGFKGNYNLMPSKQRKNGLWSKQQTWCFTNKWKYAKNNILWFQNLVKDSVVNKNFLKRKLKFSVITLLLKQG